MEQQPFQGFSEAANEFLWGIRLNNERSWFQEHKQEFEEHLNRPFRMLANDTLALMQEAFPEYNFMAHVSRIYRDARRLFGRGPYYDYMWFSIQPGIDKSRGPRFWFELDPQGYSHGMGYWDGTPAFAEAFRKKIAAHPAQFEEIILSVPDRERGWLRGEEYKKPKGHFNERIDPWFNRKTIEVGYNDFFEKLIFTDMLPELLTASYSQLTPLFDFMLDAYHVAEKARTESE